MPITVEKLVSSIDESIVWDFSSVPDKEIECCYHYELALQCTALSESFRSYVRGKTDTSERQLFLAFVNEDVCPVKINNYYYELLPDTAYAYLADDSWLKIGSSNLLAFLQYQPSADLKFFSSQQFPEEDGWVYIPLYINLNSTENRICEDFRTWVHDSIKPTGRAAVGRSLGTPQGYRQALRQIVYYRIVKAAVGEIDPNMSQDDLSLHFDEAFKKHIQPLVSDGASEEQLADVWYAPQEKSSWKTAVDSVYRVICQNFPPVSR